MSPKKTCSVNGCDKPTKSKGMCAQHYRKHYYATHREHEIKTAVERGKKKR
jgi:hypothetical protein